jgi:alpha-L-arabinofuranosidase
LGTYRTAAEFKDLRVTRGSETLFAPDFANTTGWQLPREGRWETRDGALVQSDDRAIATGWTSETTWTDYTVTLKARKLGGAEGFIIGFRNGLPNTRVQWNIGGWGNTKHGIQSWLGVQDQLVGQVPGSIEQGRWYDIKIELQGPRVNCYLDGQLVQTADIAVPKTGGIFASAVKDDAAGEVVLKLVNATTKAKDFAVNLVGVKTVKPGAKGILLAGEKLTDVNDFDNPNRLAPRALPVSITSPKFTQPVPANAFLVLRVPVQ